MAVWKTKEIDTRLKTQDSRFPCLTFYVSRFTFHVLCLASSIFLCIACGSAWHGRIVHLEDGKVVIQPVGASRQHDHIGKIESGRRLLIYRQKTITHPVTGEVLSTIRDNIGEVSVLRVRSRTITATAAEPEFGMMRVDDQAVAVRGSVKPMQAFEKSLSKKESIPGSITELGRITEVNAEEERVEVTVASGGAITPRDALTAIRYTGTVIDPDTGEVLAVAVEPVANLQVMEVDADGRLQASYDLMDGKLGWVEVDDVVVSRTGSMLAERLWFQDPPDGFSETWIFRRNYLRAIKHYDSGRYREAILELDSVIQKDPEYGDAIYLLGLCYANLNRYEEATARFKNLLGQRPDDAKTRVALAYAYLKQGKLQEAAESYEKLAYLLPGDPKVWTDMGDIYSTLGDRQKAEQAYRKALEIDGTDQEATYELQAEEEEGSATD